MNQNKLTAAAILILFLPLCWGAEMQGNERDQRPPFSEMLRRTFINTADNLKIMFNRAQSYFFYPNLDFRGSSIPREEGTKVRMMDGGGAPEDKLKDAVAESVGKTKATVEGSAKSAAELATKTIKETKEKFKTPPPHSEL